MSLVNATTTPRLLRLVESGMLDIGSLVTHRMLTPATTDGGCLTVVCNLLIGTDFPCSDAARAYDTFKAASRHKALKVAIDFDAC